LRKCSSKEKKNFNKNILNNLISDQWLSATSPKEFGKLERRLVGDRDRYGLQRRRENYLIPASKWHEKLSLDRNKKHSLQFRSSTGATGHPRQAMSREFSFSNTFELKMFKCYFRDKIESSWNKFLKMMLCHMYWPLLHTFSTLY
jgi:hypothetical protein